MSTYAFSDVGKQLIYKRLNKHVIGVSFTTNKVVNGMKDKIFYRFYDTRKYVQIYSDRLKCQLYRN